MAAIVKLFVSVLALAWISTQALASPLMLPGSEVSIVADQLVLADVKCGLVNDKLVCGKTNDHKNRDDDDDDDDHQHKGKDKDKGKDNDNDKDKATSQADCKKGTCFACGGAFPGCSCRKAYCDDLKPQKESKGKNDKPELTECTIQGPNSGGGCKSGFTRVCEKMKSGKKCCGCVADKTAPAPAEEKLEDSPCFTHCSTKCGGSGDAQKSCLIECLQTTSCRPQ